MFPIIRTKIGGENICMLPTKMCNKFATYLHPKKGKLNMVLLLGFGADGAH